MMTSLVSNDVSPKTVAMLEWGAGIILAERQAHCRSSTVNICILAFHTITSSIIRLEGPPRKVRQHIITYAGLYTSGLYVPNFKTGGFKLLSLAPCMIKA